MRRRFDYSVIRLFGYTVFNLTEKSFVYNILYYILINKHRTQNSITEQPNNRTTELSAEKLSTGNRLP